MPVRIDLGARSDVGRVRANNEDSFRSAPELNLFILSDGMGGEAAGELASQIAVETVAEHCQQANHNPALALVGAPVDGVSDKANRLVSALRLANQKIGEKSSQDGSLRGMGATAVAAWIEGQRLSLAHVGDSRAYLLRAGDLQQLTRDHSLVAEQVRRGILTAEQATQSQMQSVLTRALGAEAEVEAEAEEHVLLDGDVLLLCSDGLTRMVTDTEIASTLLTHSSAQAAADRLVELSNEYGGEDNVTVIVLRIHLGSNGLFGRLRRRLTGH